MQTVKYFLVLSAAFLITMNAHSQTGHYILGSVGNKGGFRPATGIFVQSKTSWYRAKHFYDDNGTRFSVAATIEYLTQEFVFSHTTKLNVLGGKYIYQGGLLLGNTALDYSAESIYTGGIGFMDPYISPVGIFWQNERMNAIFEYGIYLPIGRFNGEDLSNRGKGFLTHMFAFTTTFDLDKFQKWTATIKPAVEIHQKTSETVRLAGNNAHIEFAMAYQTFDRWEFGFVGYAQWQLTKDQNFNTNIPDSTTEFKDQIFALGPEMAYTVAQWNTRFALRANFEIAGKNRLQGRMITLQIDFYPNE